MTHPLSDNCPAPVALANLPTDVLDYLVHTGFGCSIRDLARMSDCHASTVSRRVRKVEQRRDDPLVDAALRKLEQHMDRDLGRTDRLTQGNLDEMTIKTAIPAAAVLPKEFEKDAQRVLRRLCEKGAVLAVAADMDMAVVVRETPDGQSTRTAVVSQDVAQELALRELIEAESSGRIMRYRITAAGRAVLEGEPKQGETSSAAAGFAEAQADFAGQHRLWGEKFIPEEGTGKSRRTRYNMTESPMTALARRRDKSGEPFLSADLVRSGERLREDFELAQMGPNVTQNWEKFLTGGVRGSHGSSSPIGNGPDAARQRVMDALGDLGPGLSDVALRCCCFLEGLETTEQRMGWSARSGKIVLRIALQRLKRHYEENVSPESQMIG